MNDAAAFAKIAEAAKSTLIFSIRISRFLILEILNFSVLI